MSEEVTNLMDALITKMERMDGVMVMPESNADWHEMGWDEIHAMANEAAISEGRPVDQ